MFRVTGLKILDRVGNNFFLSGKKYNFMHFEPVFAAMLCKVNFKHGTRDGKHDKVTSRNET